MSAESDTACTNGPMSQNVPESHEKGPRSDEEAIRDLLVVYDATGGSPARHVPDDLLLALARADGQTWGDMAEASRHTAEVMYGEQGMVVMAYARDLLAGEEMREAVAEALSCDEVFGDMTHYSEDAHPDHNRWSWRGDGHGEAYRDQYRVAAAGVLAVVAERLGGAR